MLKKKKLGQFSKNYRTFNQNIVTKLKKNIGLGSGIRKKPIPDPGSQIQGSKRHWIPEPGSGSTTLIIYIIFKIDL
jgi:hypothetical protein